MTKKNFWMPIVALDKRTNVSLSTKNFRNCLVDKKNFESIFSKIEAYNSFVDKIEKKEDA